MWFWSFIIYSFLGFLLEVVFARLTGGRAERKNLLLLPICPVYGLGACAILWLTPMAQGRPLLLLILGMGAATAVEYATAAWYEQALGVSFWDYTGLPGSIRGRICLPFSLVWGLLAVLLMRWVHPALAPLMAQIPGPVTWSMAALTGADLLVSGVMMRRTGSRDCLDWYRRGPET